MTWLYMTGFIFLMGGEINAILEHWSLDGKAQGARAEGEAPLPAHERPSLHLQPRLSHRRPSGPRQPVLCCSDPARVRIVLKRGRGRVHTRATGHPGAFPEREEEMLRLLVSLRARYIGRVRRTRRRHT